MARHGQPRPTPLLTPFRAQRQRRLVWFVALSSRTFFGVFWVVQVFATHEEAVRAHLRQQVRADAKNISHSLRSAARS